MCQTNLCGNISWYRPYYFRVYEKEKGPYGAPEAFLDVIFFVELFCVALFVKQCKSTMRTPPHTKKCYLLTGCLQSVNHSLTNIFRL